VLPDSLLVDLASLEAALLVGALVVIFGHALWAWRSRRRDAALLARAHAAIHDALQRAGPVPKAAPAVGSLSVALRIRLFSDLAVSLAGAAAVRLAALAASTGLTAAAERWCRSRWWWRRLRGVRLLTVIGGGAGIVPDLLDDPNPFVGAQAAEWAAAHPTPDVIRRLLDALSGGGRLFRFSAQDALGRIGPQAIQPITAYLDTHRGMTVEPVLEVAVGLVDARLLPAGLRFAGDESARVRVLAAALLGALGGDQAVGALLRMLEDESAGVRAASIRALGHLGEWQAAPRIALLLRDPTWQVRKEAGFTLRRFGAPGMLYLRRALADMDPFAVDMAQQMLDLPAGGEPWSMT
jgi:hypothetical protein